MIFMTQHPGIDIAALDRARILRDAQRILLEKPLHITDVPAPMSEGKANDFYSNGDYWWPNPDTPDGLPYVRRALAYLYPFLEDKSRWPLPPDVQHFDGWPVRQPALLFGGLALGNAQYLDLWQGLDADPTDDEIRRNVAIRQPVLWI